MLPPSRTAIASSTVVGRPAAIRQVMATPPMVTAPASRRGHGGDAAAIWQVGRCCPAHRRPRGPRPPVSHTIAADVSAAVGRDPAGDDQAARAAPGSPDAPCVTTWHGGVRRAIRQVLAAFPPPHVPHLALAIARVSQHPSSCVC
jgi:hypothetical protein